MLRCNKSVTDEQHHSVGRREGVSGPQHPRPGLRERAGYPKLRAHDVTYCENVGRFDPPIRHEEKDVPRCGACSLTTRCGDRAIEAEDEIVCGAVFNVVVRAIVARIPVPMSGFQRVTHD